MFWAIPEVICLLQYIISGVQVIYLIIGYVKFDHSVKVVSVSFLHCTVIIFFFIFNKLIVGDKTMQNPVSDHTIVH